MKQIVTIFWVFLVAVVGFGKAENSVIIKKGDQEKLRITETTKFTCDGGVDISFTGNTTTGSGGTSGNANQNTMNPNYKIKSDTPLVYTPDKTTFCNTDDGIKVAQGASTCTFINTDAFAFPKNPVIGGVTYDVTMAPTVYTVVDNNYRPTASEFIGTDGAEFSQNLCNCDKLETEAKFQITLSATSPQAQGSAPFSKTYGTAISVLLAGDRKTFTVTKNGDYKDSDKGLGIGVVTCLFDGGGSGAYTLSEAWKDGWYRMSIVIGFISLFFFFT